ncbi:Mor transcription activator family protein [Pseudomonas huaxiensis]|uniref:Mor transcription activator family protein n=1 Tax=Pseudomonas huaxiensis TaxID=2213017 RepID=UPI000DA6B85C|nr:Mor transcription activator family protein [Pseudomonas huaxiensis]
MQDNIAPPALRKNQAALTQSMTDMIEIIEHAIDREMERDASPAGLANASVIALCNVLGGTAVYLPRPTALKRMERDRQIFKAYIEGVPIAETLKKHKICSQTYYSIIKKQRHSLRLQTTVNGHVSD